MKNKTFGRSRGSSADGRQPHALAYGAGVFIAISSMFSRDQISISTDEGRSWTKTYEGASSSSFDAVDVAFGNDVFVAIGRETVITSSDKGKTWKRHNEIPANGSWTFHSSKITFGEGRFVAIDNGGLVRTSTDGRRWTPAKNGVGSRLCGLVYGNGTFVAVGNGNSSGNWISTSPDGISWTSRPCPTKSNLADLAFGKDTFIAVGDPARGEQIATAIVSNDNGASWKVQQEGLPFKGRPTGIAYGGGNFILVDGDTFYLSADAGDTWSEEFESEKPYYCIRFGKQFVATGRDSSLTRSLD